jgi:hypothetical protein
MKIACCLYGQPRQYKKGYKHLSKFFKKYNVDFFFHTWHSETIEYYEYSPWGNCDPLNDCKIHLDTIKNLIDIYKPIEYLVEEPKTFEISEWLSESYAYNNKILTPIIINNVMSQIYSKEQVKNIFQKYHSNYDLVICSRFDLFKDITIDLYNIDTSKLYVSNLHRPRNIFPDHIFICNPKMFCKILNMYSNLPNLVNIHECYDEQPIWFISELILYYNFFYSGYTLNDVIYSEDIPNYR